IVSDYRYRGVSQTRLKPALQGGADYTNNPTGFYVGTWLSTIKWTKDAGGDGDVEWDLYAGKRGEIVKDVSYDVGGLYYYYPSNGLHPSANTFELYGQISYGPVSLKYSQSTTNLFGFADSRGGAALNQGLSGASSYTDYKLGVTKDFGVVTVALAAVYADTKAYVGPDGKNLAKTGAVLSISKTF
ncbi:MAG: TorF family putative porin, partial [Pseudomonadota bacterium]